MKGLFSFGLFVLYYILAIVIYGFTLSVLWGWFIVPVFEAPEITIIQSVGLSLTVKSFSGFRNKDNDSETTIDLFLSMFTGNITVLTIGFIVQIFI